MRTSVIFLCKQLTLVKQIGCAFLATIYWRGQQYKCCNKTDWIFIFGMEAMTRMEKDLSTKKIVLLHHLVCIVRLIVTMINDWTLSPSY